MSILDREALTASPLADLHALASELSIDGYRRLRKAELIDAILTRQGGEPAPEDQPAEAEARGEDDRPASRRRRGRRGGRGRAVREEEEEEGSGAVADGLGEDEAEAGPAPEGVEESEEQVEPAARGERSAAEREEEIVEGEVELLPNGSGFLRVKPPEPSEDDVYVSAAQVKRCELVPGDRISGPRRAPRRSERFASLIRIDTINGQPAEEVVDSTRFDDLPAAFPTERFRLGIEDPTIKAIEWLTPFGQGSRVTIVGPARAGKTEALRRLATTLAGHDDVQVSLVLAGVRPEEISEWQQAPVTPAAAVSFAASADSQAQALEHAVDQARRLAARGAHVVVLIDTLSGIQPHAARKLLASAKNIPGGGSLTVIGTASEPLGGETTVIGLDPLLASTGRFPAIDLLASGTIRPELLVGDAGAEAIARARMEAMDG
jgi:transcription termination factor Rho